MSNNTLKQFGSLFCHLRPQSISLSGWATNASFPLPGLPGCGPMKLILDGGRLRRRRRTPLKEMEQCHWQRVEKEMAGLRLKWWVLNQRWIVSLAFSRKAFKAHESGIWLICYNILLTLSLETISHPLLIFCFDSFLINVYVRQGSICFCGLGFCVRIHEVCLHFFFPLLHTSI